MRKMFGATIALWLGMAATTAQAATDAKPCLTEAEAQGVFLALAPDAIRAVSQKCASSLPETATLRIGLTAFATPYDAAAVTAWPAAGPALAKMAGPDMTGIDPVAMKPMIGAMIGAMAADQVKPKDCATIDHAAGLLAPLPPANVAGLILLAASSGSKPGKEPFTICPTAPATATPTPARK
ncbi:MAG: hypothetical protein ABIR08_10045 [Sphingomonas sp.]